MPGFDPTIYNNPNAPQPEQPPAPPIQKVIGDALGTIGNVLEAPGNLVRGGIAAAERPILNGPAAGLSTPERITAINRMWDEGRPAHEIFDYMVNSADAAQVPVTAGLTRVVTDPLMYLGMGLPGAAGKALGVSGNMAKAFEFLNNADHAIATLPWNVGKGAVKGAAWPIGKIPVPIQVTTEAGGKAPAGNVAGWLGAPSAEAYYKQKIRDITDLVNNVIGRGHSFEQDQFEQALLDQVRKRPTPNNVNGALGIMRDEQGKLLDEVRKVSDPNARPQAMAVFQLVQQTVDKLMKEASASQVSGQPMAQAMPMFDEMRRSIVAGRVLVDRINQNPTALLEDMTRFGPGMVNQAGPVYNAYDAAINRLYPVFREAEVLRSAPGRPGGKVLGPPSPGQPSLTNWQIGEQTSQKVQGIIDQFWNDVGQTPATRTAQQWQPVLTPSGPVMQLTSQNAPLQKIVQDAVLGPHADLMRMAEATQRGLPALTGILPERLSQVATQQIPEITHQYGQLMNDRANVGKVLLEAWSKLRPGDPFPVQMPARWNQIENPNLVQTFVNPVLQALGRPPITSPDVVVTLLKDPVIRGALSPRSVNGLEAAVRKWPEGDLLTENPYLLTIDRIARDYQGQYGIKQSGLGATLRDATALWKEAQLGANPGYLVRNLLGILANSSLEGISPLKVANDFFSNLKPILGQGDTLVTNDVKNFTDAMGLALPHSITSGSAILAASNATKEYLGRGITASARVGPVKLAAAGAGLGAVSGALKPEPYQPPEVRARDVLTGAAVGAVSGAAFPALSEIFLRRIAAGMEAAGRENAYLHQAVKGLDVRLPELYKLIDATRFQTAQTVKNVATAKVGLGALAKGPGAPVTTAAGRVATPFRPNVDPAALDSIKAFIDARGGVVNPDWLTENLQRAGVNPGTAQDIGRAWRTMADAASVEGETFAGRIHVDYEKLNNFEQFMNKMMPFSIWALKMTPFYAEHVLTKPAVLYSLIDYAKLSEQYRQEQGLPSRFIGSVEDPAINGIVSAIFGRPIRTAWNPLNGFLPLADIGRLASAAPNEDNAFASAYKILTAMGPQPHPLIEFAMRTGGAFGTGEPAPPLFSFGNRVLAATGVDLNLPGVRAEQAIRRITSGGREPSDMDTFAIDRKLQELALRNIGHLPRQGDPASDPYLQARTNQAGQLWNEATKEYRQEQALRATWSLVGVPTLQTTLTPEEAQIRMARRVPSQGGQRLQIDPQQFPMVDERIDMLMAQGKARDPMPRELAYPIRQLARQAFGPPDNWDETFGPIGKQIKGYYDNGTVSELNLLYDMVKKSQILQAPQMAGYSGGMSPEETQLSAMMASYNNPGSLVQNLSPDAQAALTRAWWVYQNAGPAIGSRLMQDKSASGYWLQMANGARDAYRNGNPLLDQYLKYLSARPGGNMTDFLDHYWNKGVTGMGTQ